MNKAYISAFISGTIFAIGLGISGMMKPEKVQGFLDLSGKWDPSLAFVMLGAVAVTFLLFPVIYKRKTPVFEDHFAIPTNKSIDKKLITGAVLFGTGWGVAGLCPGPAIANISSFSPSIILFIISMFSGFYLQSVLSVKKDKNLKSLVIDECTVD